MKEVTEIWRGEQCDNVCWASFSDPGSSGLTSKLSGKVIDAAIN